MRAIWRNTSSRGLRAGAPCRAPSRPPWISPGSENRRASSTLAPGARFNRFGLRRGPIRVCVNTDDAGIMPTTLRTEYALLREAALEHGVTRTDADNWLSRLRTFGHDEFQRKHRTVWVERRGGGARNPA